MINGTNIKSSVAGLNNTKVNNPNIYENIKNNPYTLKTRKNF